MPVYTFAADKDIDFTCRVKVTSGAVHETVEAQVILGEMKDGAVLPVSSFNPVNSSSLQVLYGSKDTEFDLKCLYYAGTLQPGVYLLRMHGLSTLFNNYMGLLVVTDPTDPTGIQPVLSVKDQPSGIYDLQGRKVNSQFSILNSQFKKGIYIHRGKKVVIK